MQLKDFADWKRIRTMSTWVGIVALAYLVYPMGWDLYWDVYTPDTGLAAVTAKNSEQIGLLVTASAEHEEGQKEQYDDIQRQLKDLKLLWGLAVVTEAGDDESWVAINLSSPAVRLKQGQRLRITNVDDGERSITTRVNGSFKAGQEYLIRLSAEAAREIEASKNEIQVIIEPIAPEEGRAD